MKADTAEDEETAKHSPSKIEAMQAEISRIQEENAVR
jgi:hypothetical protein